MALLDQALLHRIGNALRDRLLVQEMDFALRRMDVDVDGAGVDMEAEIDEGRGAFREDVGVDRFQGFLYP
jgi:hypothetical protein